MRVAAREAGMSVTDSYNHQALLMGLSHMIILCNWNPFAFAQCTTQRTVLQMVQRASKWSKALWTDVPALFKSQQCRADTFHHLLSFKEVLQLTD